MFTTKEVLNIVKEAEAEIAIKKGRKRLYRRSISVEIKDNKEDELENVVSNSESNCIIVAAKKLI